MALTLYLGSEQIKENKGIVALNDTYIILMDAVNDNSDIKVKYTNLLRYTEHSKV